MTSTGEPEQRDLRRMLIALGALALLGVITVGAGVWWLLGRARRPSIPPPETLDITVGPSEAYELYRAEILGTAGRNFSTLREGSTRNGAEYARDHVDLRSFADQVDAGVRERVAMDVVEAYFGGDTAAVALLGTDDLVAKLASGDLPRRREALGRVVASQPFETGTQGSWNERVAAYVRFEATFKEDRFAEVDVDLLYVGGGEWRVSDVVALPYPPGKRRTHPLASNFSIDRESCQECSAIRYRRSGTEWQEIPGRKEHQHAWTRGAPFGPLDPVPEGVVVLVSRPPFLVGVIFRRLGIQTPNRCDYDWAYRDDGGTSLDPADPAVRTGSCKDAAQVRVGGVPIDWSTASAGKAWLQYARQAGETIADEDPRICVTTLRAFADARSDDGRWRFLASRSDPGVLVPGGGR